MAGRITKSEEQLRPDPKFGNKALSRFINCVMRDGKKSVAQRVVYDALQLIEERTKGNPSAIEVFEAAIDNVKPRVEVRSKRVGGANYQVPMQVNRRRQMSLAYRWIINSARDEKGKPMAQRLARELYDASNREGKAVNIREQTHRMADANKAFAHFAW
ncbi:30S ribosomal protein S7 [Planctomycetales bacterium ZRK34]|nr:30S ribosomal protein S7 [Planctomycetales bacterium ZRK34]